MSHMTQTANPVTFLRPPLGEEGHEVAKGWTVVILIMILDVDVTAEGGHNPRAGGPSTLTPKVCPMLPANIVISSGAACWYVTDGNRSNDTLSREISHRNAFLTIKA